MILIAGSANLDFVVRAPRIPAAGETVLGSSFRTFAGGKGANQAVACAKAGGVATRMLLALGRDSFAEPIEASLRAAGVALQLVRPDDMPTGTAFICVSDDAENAITVAPGANLALQPVHLPDLGGIKTLLMQLEIPLATVAAYAATARKSGVQVVLNAAPAQPLPSALVALVDVLVVNQGELASISNCAGSVAACLKCLHALPCIVVTLGAQGCCARVGNQLILQPAFAVTAVDTTAAGDTFCGVLVASLSLQLPLSQALERASAAAALACTKHGAQASIPTLAEINLFLTSQSADTSTNADAMAALAQFIGLDF